MPLREEYLLRAAELSAMAQAESDAARKAEFENMARAYLRLVEQAERNSLVPNIVYASPPNNDDQADEQTARTTGSKPDNDKE